MFSKSNFLITLTILCRTRGLSALQSIKLVPSSTRNPFRRSLPTVSSSSLQTLQVGHPSHQFCSPRTYLAASCTDIKQDNLPALWKRRMTRRQLIIRREMSTSPEDRNHDTDDRQDSANDTSLRRSSISPIMFNVLPFFGKFAAGIGALGVGVLGLLYVKQGDLLYIPTIDVVGRDNSQNPRGYRSPAEYDIPYETHMIESVDGVAVHSWLLLHPQSKEKQLPTIIFFHGNAGNIGVRVPNAVELYKLNANVLLVEYRGYGESTPEHIKPSEKGIKLDSEAVLRFITNHPSVDPSRIFVFGRSLGGAVAFHVADYAEKNKMPLAGIIVENTFESIGHMVDVLLPFLSPFKNVLLRNKWDSTRLAADLKVPILYIAGDADEIVPYTQMRDLYAKSSSSSIMPRFHRVEGGTHNETWLQGGRAYWNAIKSFLTDAVAEGTSKGQAAEKVD